MAEENEIIAVFRAEIEQYKKDVVEATAVTGDLDKKVKETVTSTQKFDKQTKGASASVSTLSRGLGGVAGLLGVTGRLFGVNTDKIEALVFASREFVRVGQDIAKAQKLATGATVAGTAATTAQTAAERILNVVRSASAGVIGLVVAGVTALGVAIYSYIQGLNEEERALKRKQAIGKEQIKINNKLTEQFNERSKQAGETALSEGVRTGLITERQAEEIKLNEKFDKQTDENRKEIEKQRIEAAKKSKNIFGMISIADQERINKNEKELFNAAFNDLEEDKKALREKFAKEDADEQKKIDDKKREDNKKTAQQILDDTKKANDDLLKEVQSEADRLTAIDIARRDKKRKDEKDLQKQLLNDQDEFLKETLAKWDKEAEEEEKIRLKRIDDLQNISDITFTAQQEAFAKRQELLDKEITSQEKNIDIQRDLAARGLDNTLAFDQRRAAELQRQQQIDAQKQKRVKLLETFLNSLAEFSKDKPETAIQRALLQVALAQAASAVFAEDGGIIGEIGDRSNGLRKHKGGGDVLLHAQTGEGILSRREMDNLGKRNFHLLKDAARFPIRDDVFAMPKLAIAGGMAVSNHEVVKELKALQHIVKNKRESHWDVNRFGEYVTTSIENGVTEITKGKLKKPRFRG